MVDIIAADDDDRFVADFEQEVIALPAHPIDVAGDDPFARDDVLEVRGENVIVAIESLIQAIAAARARGQLSDHRGALRGGIMLLESRDALFII